MQFDGMNKVVDVMMVVFLRHHSPQSTHQPRSLDNNLCAMESIDVMAALLCIYLLEKCILLHKLSRNTSFARA